MNMNSLSILTSIITIVGISVEIARQSAGTAPRLVRGILAAPALPVLCPIRKVTSKHR